MRRSLTKYDSITVIIIIVPLTISPLCLLLLVRLGPLHSEFVCLLFFQDHRETDRYYFSVSGVHNLPVTSLGLSKLGDSIYCNK
jgi:hypothetical protein